MIMPLFIVILFACTQKNHHNDRRLLFIEITAGRHHFSHYQLTISNLALISDTDVVNLVEAKQINLSSSFIALETKEIKNNHYHTVELDIDMQDSVIIPDIVGQASIISFWSRSNQSVPDERSMFRVKLPIQYLTHQDGAVKLRIDFNPEQSTRALLNEQYRLHYLFDPKVTATIESPEELLFKTPLQGNDDNGYSIKQNGIHFNLSMQEGGSLLNNKENSHANTLTALSKNQVPVTIIANYQQGKQHTLSVTKLYVEQQDLTEMPNLIVPEPQDSGNSKTGYIKQIDGNSYLVIEKLMIDSQSIPFELSTSTILASDDSIADQINLNEPLIFPYQKAEIVLDDEQQVTAFKILPSRCLVYFHDGKPDILSINDIAIDNNNMQTVPFRLNFESASGLRDGLYEITGFFSKSGFFITERKAIELSSVKFNMVTLANQEYAPRISLQNNRNEIEFPASTLKNAFIDIELQNNSIKINTRIDKLILTNAGSFQLSREENSEQTISRFDQSTDYLLNLESTLESEEIIHVAGEGELNESSLILNKAIISLRPLQPSLNKTLLSENVTGITAWQKGVIAAGTLTGIIALVTLARWYNTTLEKPWLDFLLQINTHKRIAYDTDVFNNPIKVDLTRTDDQGNRKYDNEVTQAIKEGNTANLLNNDIEIALNSTNEIQFKINSKEVIVSNNQKVEYFTNHFDETLHNNNKKVILYLPGFAEHAGIHKKLKVTHGKDPLEEIGKNVDADVYSMNFPPFGNSRWNNSKRLDLNDAYSSAQAMVEKLVADGYKIENLTLWSQCLGGNTAIRLANRYPKIDGVILDAVPTKIEDLFINPVMRAASKVMAPFIISQKLLKSHEQIKAVKTIPALITHHVKDNLVSFTHSQNSMQLFENKTYVVDPVSKPNRLKSHYVNHMIDMGQSRIQPVQRFMRRKR